MIFSFLLITVKMEKQSLFKQSLQSSKLTTYTPSPQLPVTWLCMNCSNIQTFGKNDLIKCKSCNHRIFYKQRNTSIPSMYVAI